MKNIFQTIKLILWAFLGIRSTNETEKDFKLNPIHIILTAFIFVLIFISSLILIVNNVANVTK